jgi:hypothetical protein
MIENLSRQTEAQTTGHDPPGPRIALGSLGDSPTGPTDPLQERSAAHLLGSPQQLGFLVSRQKRPDRQQLDRIRGALRRRQGDG